MQNWLFIIDHLKGGGAEKITIDLIGVLKKYANIKLLLLDGSDAEMTDAHIETLTLDIHPDFFAAGLWHKRSFVLCERDLARLNHLVQEARPDKIIVGFWYGYYITPYLPKNIYIYLWFHGQAFNLKRRPRPNVFRRYKENRRLKREVAAFRAICEHKNLIFVNDDIKQEAAAVLKNALCYTVPNGVNEQAVLSLAAQKITDLCDDNLHAKRWDCVFVGRLNIEKQVDHAITAFAKSGLTGKMAIVGAGSLLDELMQLCVQLSVADRVEFLGWQKNPYPFIAKSRCLILSSKEEGCPLVVVEALMLDVPVAAYDINAGVRGQLAGAPLDRGLAVPQDVDDLAVKIADLVQNPYVVPKATKKALGIEKMARDFAAVLMDSATNATH